jgi:hypothetical protein
MKRNFSPGKRHFLYLLITISIIYACQTDDETVHLEESRNLRSITVEEVKEKYNEIMKSGIYKRKDEAFIINILWDNGIYKELSIGDELAFPLRSLTGEETEKVYFSVGSDSIKYIHDYHSFALAYKDSTGLHLDYYKVIPTERTEKFTGYLMVYEWNRELKYLHYYSNSIFVETKIPSINIGENFLAAKNSDCIELHHYTCVTVVVVSAQSTSCHHSHTTTTCSTGSNPEGPDPDDFFNGSNGGGAGPIGSLENKCPHPYIEGMMIDCDQIVCPPGYESDGLGGCKPELCSNGFIRNSSGDCQCPSFMEVINEQCVFKCGPGFRRNETGVCVQVENCNTDDAIINALQAQLETLWKNSNASHTSIPMGNRMERGGWIVSSGGGYSFVPFPSTWVMTPCGIDGTLNPGDIPPNLVGIIHTHPFYQGEDTRGVCGSGENEGEESYAGGPSDPDAELLYKVSELVENFGLKGYVIDGNNIHTFNALASFTGQFTTTSRCNY